MRLGGDCQIVELGLGLSWRVYEDPYGQGLSPLVSLALRDNPKRAQLVVSKALGKHLPVTPERAVGAAERLARLVGPVDCAVIGFCETATSLGHLVAEALEAPYVHTTRRPDPGLPPLTGFDEEHSHAVAHTLQPRPGLLDASTIVLVDDELTTGTTALNTVQALKAHLPAQRWVVATLLDLREDRAREQFAERVDQLGTDVRVVSLVSGALLVPDDVQERALALRTRLEAVPPAPAPREHGAVRLLDVDWPAEVPLGGRTGTTPQDLHRQREALTDVAGALRLSGGPVLVLGTEEFMWAPLRLADQLPGALFQSTTRSPVLAADIDGYAVRRVVRFEAPDDPGRPSRLHGLPAAAYADVVVVTDTSAVAAAGLAEVLRPWGDVHVVGLGGS